MNILAIETSTKTFSLAVMKNNKIVKHRQIVLKKVLSSSIIPAIDKILKASQLALEKLDGFAVGLGPGSFTSLRVGLSTIKGLAFATGKPIVGIPSLDALALNVAEEVDGDICTISDAKRQLVYGCIYEHQNGNMKPHSDYMLMPIVEILARLKGKTLFVGDAIGLYREMIIQQCPQAIFADEKKWLPQAKAVGLLALERFKTKKFDDIDRLVPLYLYPADCQVQRTK